MKKKKKLFVIGTSHVADGHYNNKPREKCNAGYPDYRNGELTWPNYLGKKLNREVDNCGINAYGIDTYFYRIQNIIQNNKDIELLIEVPTGGRYELYLNDSYYVPGSMSFEKDFWSENSLGYRSEHERELYEDLRDSISTATTKDNCDKAMKKLRKTRFPYVWNYSKEDILRLSSNAVKPADDHQLDFLKEVAVRYCGSLFPTRKQLDGLLRATISSASNKFEKDAIVVKCIMINGYLQNLKIPTTWFTTTFNYSKVYSDNLNKLNFINFSKPLFGHFVKDTDKIYELRKKDINLCNKLFPDGWHLYKDGWRELVDKFFVPYYNKRND